MKKYILLLSTLFITVQSISARNIVIKNPSKQNIMLLPLWQGQGKYDILFSPVDYPSSKFAKKTYPLGTHTIKRVAWIELDTAGLFKTKTAPKNNVKYFVDINMGPLGKDKMFIISDNGYYSYDSSEYKKAQSTELSVEEKQFFE